QITCPSPSSAAPPTTHSASSTSPAVVGSSASRPAAAVPSTCPIAPAVSASSAASAAGRRSRRQSTARDGSGARRAGRGAASGRLAASVVSVVSGAVIMPPTTLRPTIDVARHIFGRPAVTVTNVSPGGVPRLSVEVRQAWPERVPPLERVVAHRDRHPLLLVVDTEPVVEAVADLAALGEALRPAVLAADDHDDVGGRRRRGERGERVVPADDRHATAAVPVERARLAVVARDHDVGAGVDGDV